MTDTCDGVVVCVVGPTATGKSELAQAIAERIDGEIVSADSMQIYRGMDIGTAKVPKDERSVAYYGIDLVDPGEQYSASLFQEYARDVFKDIVSRGKTPVLVGGTGFYVRAAIDDYDFPKGEQIENPIRTYWKDYLEQNDAEALWNELYLRDPSSAEVLHPNNTKRVIRALELHEQGISYHDQLENLQTIQQSVPAVFIGLTCERQALYERVERRVDRMRTAGLEGEVISLLDRGFRSAVTAQQAIGYKEIVDALDGNITMDEAYDAIKKATRHYVKRQCTWFRKDERIQWIDGTDETLHDLVNEALAKLNDRDHGMGEQNGKA